MRLLLFSDAKKGIESILQLARVPGSQVRTDLISKVLRFSKLPQLTSEATGDLASVVHSQRT